MYLYHTVPDGAEVRVTFTNGNFIVLYACISERGYIDYLHKGDNRRVDPQMVAAASCTKIKSVVMTATHEIDVAEIILEAGRHE